jgi:hypothetical protein
MGLTKRPRRTAPPPPMPVVTLEADLARATLPAGATASMPISALLERLRPRTPDTADVVLPDGVKALVPTANGCILVHQTTPRVFNFRWIANDSPAPFGKKTKYRQVRIGLPYLIVLAGFKNGGSEIMRLSNRNECFFSNHPLDKLGFDSELFYPALLNCSKFPSDKDNPLSWICTQHLDRSPLDEEKTLQSSLRAGMAMLLRHLLESGFNHSSEEHELSSWFSETVKADVDPRVASVEAWEDATRNDPCFALDVPWLETGCTLGQVTHRIAERSGRLDLGDLQTMDVARVIFRAGKKG